jgi:hypothetical protein
MARRQRTEREIYWQDLIDRSRSRFLRHQGGSGIRAVF